MKFYWENTNTLIVLAPAPVQTFTLGWGTDRLIPPPVGGKLTWQVKLSAILRHDLNR